MQPVQRYYALDALRAAMMLLGIVLHSMASYAALPLGDAWPFKDERTTAHFNLPLLLIHVFRMPAFFAMAGFFAALLAARGGIIGLARNRAARVLLPFLIFWVALAPPVAGGFLLAIHQRTGMRVTAIIAEGTRTTPVNTMHLWFLYYLLIFYAAAIALLFMLRRRSLPDGICAAMTTSGWSPLFWIAVTSATLLPMPFPGIEGSTLLLPPLRTLVAYGVFFVFGWILFRGRERLTTLERWWWRLPVVAAIAIAGYVYLEIRPLSSARTQHVVRCVLMAMSMWTLVLGLIGTFLRFVRRAHPGVVYLSRSAYWVYLVHLPVVIWIAALLVHAALPAMVKFSIVLVGTAAVSLLTYHYFVRRTIVGVLLNGAREPAIVVPTAAGSSA